MKLSCKFRVILVAIIWVILIHTITFVQSKYLTSGFSSNSTNDIVDNLALSLKNNFELRYLKRCSNNYCGDQWDIHNPSIIGYWKSLDLENAELPLKFINLPQKKIALGKFVRVLKTFIWDKPAKLMLK